MKHTPDPAEYSGTIELEGFRPEWLSDENARPYKLTIGEDPIFDAITVKVTTPRLGAGTLVSGSAVEQTGLKPAELIQHAADATTAQLKRKLITAYGLEAEVKGELFRKLLDAAKLIHRPDERAAVVSFLYELRGPIVTGER